MKTSQSLQKQNIEDFQVIDNFVANFVYVFITDIYNTSEIPGTHHQKHKKGEMMILWQALKTCQSLQSQKTEDFHVIDQYMAANIYK